MARDARLQREVVSLWVRIPIRRMIDVNWNSHPTGRLTWPGRRQVGRRYRPGASSVATDRSPHHEGDRTRPACPTKRGGRLFPAPPVSTVRRFFAQKRGFDIVVYEIVHGLHGRMTAFKAHI